MIRIGLSNWTQSEALTGLDVLVIGGGATGLGVAVQSGLEGRRVALVEAKDFACGTSSRSTKLLHGGVRYLAQGRIHLVREALRERATVLSLAPHLAQPLSFVVAESNVASWLFTAIGLKVYQILAGRLSLGPTEALGATAMRNILSTWPKVVAGIRYWDGQFDDARLALAMARTADTAGAALRNHTRAVDLRQTARGWEVTLQDAFSGEQATVHTRSVVNATGVWVDEIRRLAHQRTLTAQNSVCEASAPFKTMVRASQGVHIVVSRTKLPLNEAVLVPRTEDGRVLFAVPWLGAVVIGTTDTPRDDAPLEPRPYQQELQFLMGETHRALGVKLEEEDVQSVWVGLRPLVDDSGNKNAKTAAISREHLIVRETSGLFSVTGGKWTTYRVMAADVMAALVNSKDLPPPQVVARTVDHELFGSASNTGLMHSLKDPPGMHLFGAEADKISLMPGHNQLIGMGLTESMVRFSARYEWATTVEDVLARRWRSLFLNAQKAETMAPHVARILEQETGLDPQLEDFIDLCRQYRLPSMRCSVTA